MINTKYAVMLLWLAFLFTGGAQAQTRIIDIDPAQAVASVSPSMYGIFFEDINMGADGGLYAELVKNRSFEFFKPLMGWQVLGRRRTEGDALVINESKASSPNTHFLRLLLYDGNADSLGLRNEGFRGMGIRAGERYVFSLLHRQQADPVRVRLQLVDSAGACMADTSFILKGDAENWKRDSFSFRANGSAAKASLILWFSGRGALDLDMISLFPTDTWKQRPGGLRADLVQALADLKPGFLRFPGGCIVEGYDLNLRYQWKKTIGPVEDRPVIINRWNTEFQSRLTPDYFQDFGLGFFEYFQLAEDIGASPLPILNCGMACQFNSAEVAPLNQMDPYVQDALDLIEFANGDSSTHWGRIRCSLGHAAPFHLKMLGVGNENWGPQYLERLLLFTRAIKSRYPDIRIINSSGTDPDGPRYDFLNQWLRSRNADLIDEHYYRPPEWFFAHAGRYDSFPRNGSRVFAGEYAAHDYSPPGPSNRNTWLSALSEAAFLTGLERNAAVVRMASYAPLLAHVDAWQWKPDLIWFDNLRVYRTPNYYVQQLFSWNKGTEVVPALLDGRPVEGQDSLYVSAATDSVTHTLLITLVNAAGHTAALQLRLAGWKRRKSEAGLTLLQNNNLKAVNEPGIKPMVVPAFSRQAFSGSRINYAAPPYSVTVWKIPLPRS